MSHELVTYIVLGSAERLKKLKCPKSNKSEEFLFANFPDAKVSEKQVDDLVTQSNGKLIVFLPPSTFPSTNAKKSLKKISMIDLSTWGWFKLNEKKNIFKNIKKISTSLRNIPQLEQGIFFSKRLYFSVGGIGKFESNPFNELSKRFYSRIDPQNPLPALIIRTKNHNIF